LIGSSLSIVVNKVISYGGGDNDILLASGNIKALFQRGITALTNTGFFRYQLPLLFVSLVVLPLLLIKAFKKNEKNGSISLLILLILICQVLQNFFAISYPFKKMLVDLPVIMLLLFLVFNDFDLKTFVLKTSGKFLMLAWLLAAIVICWFNYKTNKSPDYWNYNGVGCFGATPMWFNIINIGSCMTLAGIFIWGVLFNSYSYGKSAFTFLFVVSLLINLVFTINVFIVNRKYEVRDCLVGLRPLINNKVVIEGFPLTYQLYTDCKPALNGYEIDFIDKPSNEVFNRMLANKQADFVIDKVMSGNPPYHKDYPALTLVKVCNFECYSYYVYKNSLE